MTYATKKIIYLLGVVALLATGCAPQTAAPTKVSARSLSPTKKIILGKATLSVQVATTPNEQQQGLSSIPSIQSNEGMLFPYSPAATAVFWMKDMLFPIDIIWIRHNTVIGINENIMPPAAAHTDNALTRYPSPGTVDAVLEVQAGWALKHGIHTGSIVTGL